MTRWYTYALARGSALLMLAGAATGLQAQTFDEAVRANFALGTSLCLDVMTQGAAPATAFGSAGFAYRGEYRGVNAYGIDLGTDHYFDAPAQTAHAEVPDPNLPGVLCQVFTRHMPEAAAAQLVAQVLFQRHPGAQVRSASEWIVTDATALPLIVTVRTIGTNHRYEAPGTVHVSMSHPG